MNIADVQGRDRVRAGSAWLQALEGGLGGSLGDYVKRACLGGAIGAIAGVALMTIAMLIFSLATPSLNSIVNNFGLLMALAIVVGHAMPTHLTLSASSGSYQGPLLVFSTRFPINTLTILALIAAGYGGYWAGVRGRLSWAAGIGVAIIYATIVVILALLLDQYAQTSVLQQQGLPGGLSNLVLDVSPDLPGAWLMAFVLALPVAILGAAIRGTDLSRLTRARAWRPWHGPVIGTVVAMVLCLLAAFVVFLSVVLFADTTALFSGRPLLEAVTNLDQSNLVGYQVLAGPGAAATLLGIGMGASIRGSWSAPPEVPDNVHHGAWSLLNGGSFDSLFNLLPLLPLLACVLGGLVALRVSRRYSSAFLMAIPFALINLVLGGLAALDLQVSIASEARPHQASLSFLTPQLLEQPGSLMYSLRQLHLTAYASLSLDLLEVVVGAAVIALAGALIAAFLYFLWQALGRLQPPALETASMGPSPSPSGAGGPSFTPSSGPRGQTATHYDVPTMDVPARTGRKTVRRDSPRRQDVQEAHVTTRAPQARRVCPQCGHVSVNAERCPSCSAPLEV